MDDVNYYKVLDVSENASQHEIKNAYRKLARRYHPDKNSKVSDDIMKNLNIAFEILSDSNKRQEYDKIFLAIVSKKYVDINQTQDNNLGPAQSGQEVSTNLTDKDNQTLGSHDDGDDYFRDKSSLNQENVSLVKSDNNASESRYHVIIEPSLCLAFGSCETLAPKVFVVEKDRQINPKAIVISETGEDFEVILDAAKTCPTKAIIIIDRYTGKCIYP